jgi:hypothetical protein
MSFEMSRRSFVKVGTMGAAAYALPRELHAARKVAGADRFYSKPVHGRLPHRCCRAPPHGLHGLAAQHLASSS